MDTNYLNFDHQLRIWFLGLLFHCSFSERFFSSEYFPYFCLKFKKDFMSYITLTGRKLKRAIAVEKTVMSMISVYRSETDPEIKEEISFMIQPALWFILPYNKDKVVQISSEFYYSFLDNPNQTISYNHIDKRKDVAKRIFDTYGYYDWKGDGKTIEKIINEFQFSILTRSENSAGFKGEPTLLPISTDMVYQIVKYQMYWRKGWFQSRPLRNYDELKKIPLERRKFRKENDLLECMGLV